MAQFLTAAKIEYIYVPEKMGKTSDKAPCFSLPRQNTYIYETADITLPMTASAEAERFCFSGDGKFSSFKEDWAAVMRCPSCRKMFFSSSVLMSCPACNTEKCEVYALGTEGIPGWFGGQGEPLFDEEHPRYVRAWQAAAEKLLASGLPFEINTGAISRGYRSVPYPAPPILRYLGQRGARFLLSSDSHAPGTLCFGFESWRRQAEAWGCRFIDSPL